MKIMKISMQLYQYSYYLMREWDKRAGMPPWFTEYKTVVFLFAVETWTLFAVYSFVEYIIPGSPIRSMPSILIMFLYALAMCYFNQRLLGSQSRIQHYQEIFDAWDKGKRARWTIYVIAIVVLTFGGFLLGAEANRKLLQP
jgi:hypothetical protein